MDASEQKMRMRMKNTRTFEGGVEDGENLNRPLRTLTGTVTLTLTLTPNRNPNPETLS